MAERMLNLKSSTIFFAVLALPVFSLFRLTPYYGVIMCAAGTLFLLSMLRTRFKLWAPRNALAISSVFLVPIISVAWSIDPQATVVRAIPTLISFIIFWITAAHLSNHPLTENDLAFRLARAVPFVSMLVFGYLFARFGFVRAPTYEQANTVGAISNLVGAMCVTSIPFLISEKQRLPITAVAVCLGCVVLSGGRAAMGLSVLAVLITMFALGRAKFSRNIIFIFGALIAATALYQLTDFGESVDQVFDRFTNSQLFERGSFFHAEPGESDYGRSAMYLYGYRAAFETPLGIGYGALPSYMMRDLVFGFISHNILITFWSELGVVGSIALLAALTSCISAIRKSPPSDLKSALIAAGIILIAQSLFRPPLANILLPIVLANIWALPRRAIKQK